MRTSSSRPRIVLLTPFQTTERALTTNAQVRIAALAATGDLVSWTTQARAESRAVGIGTQRTRREHAVLSAACLVAYHVVIAALALALIETCLTVAAAVVPARASLLRGVRAARAFLRTPIYAHLVDAVAARPAGTENTPGG